MITGNPGPTAMRPKTLRVRAPKRGGFSLLEVLVALLVLSLGLLGLAALQTLGLRFNHESYARTQASMLAYDMIDRIRANPVGRTAGHYDDVSGSGTPEPPVNCSENPCTPEQMAIYDIAMWKTAIKNLLPQGTGEIETNGSRRTITIRWMEREDLPQLTQALVVQVDL